MRSILCPVLLSVRTYSEGQGTMTPTVHGSNACETAPIMFETVVPTRNDSSGRRRVRESALRSASAVRSG